MQREDVVAYTVCIFLHSALETYYLYAMRRLECGHIFCETCLERRFIKTRVDFYHRNTVLEGTSEHPLANDWNSPFYTCPGCGRRVVRPPTMCYPLRALVRYVASRTNTSPEAAGLTDGYMHRDWRDFFT